MKIVVNDRVHLTEYRLSDSDALVQLLNDRDIYERTLRIPFPYTDADAEDWLAQVAVIVRQEGPQAHFAIRDDDDGLIGGCGFDRVQGSQKHRAEVGYWLGKRFWGQGIMTAVVRRLCRYAFEEFELTKITAHVFVHNPASARVLEKCGFQQEGYLRKHHLKDNKLIDARLFALLAEEAPVASETK
jgi:RimJ/RimL family protein N-acetyltransferase